MSVDRALVCLAVVAKGLLSSLDDTFKDPGITWHTLPLLVEHDKVILVQKPKERLLG